MFFECKLEFDNQVEHWNGCIKRFINYGSHYEIFIESRSSILVLFGRSSSGGFACIPDFQAGCHLTDLDNKFWNTEKLSAVLGKVDGTTVASALHKLFQKCIF
jgi:hypothetical protein